MSNQENSNEKADDVFDALEQTVAALKLVWNDKNTRLGRDTVSNMPISEIIRAAIKNGEEALLQ